MAIFSSRDCSICKGSHHASRCEKITSLKPGERRRFVEKHRLCYNCLGNNHEVRQCPSTGVCKSCKGQHHTILHTDKRRDPDCTDDTPSKIRQL